jgi:hypothetical protein
MFIKENEDFLSQTRNETGTTNLGKYFDQYLQTKTEQDRLDAIPKDVMVPQSILQS